MNRAGETLTNLATFALSLLLAVFIWMSASQSQDPIRTRFLEVPVQYVGLPEDTTLVFRFDWRGLIPPCSSSRLMISPRLWT